MTIADRIRNRRLELGLSVDDLAARLNKNRATVYRYESNYIKSYSPEVMESLADALDTTPAYFYGYEDHEQSDSAQVDPEIHIVSGMMEGLPKDTKEMIVSIVRSIVMQQNKKG